MKSIAFFLLFLGLVSLSIAGPTAFLDELFAPNVYTVNSALANCNATDSCVGKGDTCAGDYAGHDSPTCAPMNGTCCAAGLYCVNKTCVVNTEGGKCSTAGDCLPGGMACVNSTCQYMMQIGEDCTDNSLCYSGKCNVTCQGSGYNGPCTSSFNCNFGLYCNYNYVTMNGTCQNTTAQGSACGAVPCSPGNVCFPKTFGNGSTCQQVGSQTAGNPCVPLACGDGLVCAATNASQPGNYSCVSATTSSTSCTSSDNCTTGSLCLCSYVTGSSYCAGPTYTSCTEETLDYIQCLADASCFLTSNPEASGSCANSNCESDYKKSQSCGCSVSDSQGGKCYYNQYCGGFPVWAIIVIIVVAIVLVLAIVLLVFFMMRRRRHYDSI